MVTIYASATPAASNSVAKAAGKTTRNLVVTVAPSLNRSCQSSPEPQRKTLTRTGGASRANILFFRAPTKNPGACQPPGSRGSDSRAKPGGSSPGLLPGVLLGQVGQFLADRGVVAELHREARRPGPAFVHPTPYPVSGRTSGGFSANTMSSLGTPAATNSSATG